MGPVRARHFGFERNVQVAVHKLKFACLYQGPAQIPVLTTLNGPDGVSDAQVNFPLLDTMTSDTQARPVLAMSF